jgi:hypothetical protein
MAFPTVTDRNVQYPNRVTLTPVSGTTYDIAPAPGNVVAAGTDVNAALFGAVNTATQVGTQIAAATTGATPDDADTFGYADTSASNATKKLTWANIKSFFVTAVPPTWHTVGSAGEPAFINSWVNFGSGTFGAAFSKDAHGIVRVRGCIKNGTVGQDAFTLPTDYRPTGQCSFPGVSNGAFGVIQVGTTGGVRVASGSNAYTYLDCVFFATN